MSVIRWVMLLGVTVKIATKFSVGRRKLHHEYYFCYKELLPDSLLFLIYYMKTNSNRFIAIN